MAVRSILKTRIILHNEKRYPFLDFLQEGGFFQIENISGEIKPELKSEFEKENIEFDYKLAQCEFAIKLLKQHDTKSKKPLANLLLGDKEIVSENKVIEIANGFYWKEVVEKCQTANDQIVKHKNHIKNVELERKQLLPWKRLILPLSATIETSLTKSKLFSVNNSQWDELKKAIQKNKSADARLVNHDESKSHGVLIYLKKDEAEVSALASGFSSFEEINLPLRRGSASEEIERLERIEKKDRKEVEKAVGEIEYLVAELPKLKIIYDYLLQKRDRQIARRKFFHSEKLVIVEGWMPSDFVEKVEDKLRHLCGKEFVFEKIKLKKDEMPPVVLENRGVAWPFEAVTGIYGLPKADEPDPTPLLAVFFIIFFGLCLSEAMYGLLLSAICFSALKLLRMPKADKKLFVLLSWGGLVTFVVGALFGGWFGMTVEQAPGFLTTVGADGQKHFIFQLINPTEGNGPLTFLILAFGVGVVHLMFGIGVDGWWKWKQGNKIDALLGPFLWLLVIVLGILTAALGGFMVNLLLLGVLGLVVANSRVAFADWNKKSLVGKIISFPFGLFKGLLSLYGAVGYVSDVLSYSRLMALGLGTGIIAYAVNVIAGIVIDMIPVVGIVVAIVILIIGHLGNLGLSSLGAFIHSGRLQYVEFFGKFLEGGGSAFKPFRKERKYTLSSDEF